MPDAAADRAAGTARAAARPGGVARDRVVEHAAPSGGLALVAHRSDGSRLGAAAATSRWSPRERRSLDGADARRASPSTWCAATFRSSGIGGLEHRRARRGRVATPPPPDARAAGAAPGRDARRAVPLAVSCPRTRRARLVFGRGARDAAAISRRRGGRAERRARRLRRAYGGTGNWTFNAAYAGARGLRAVVGYLRGIDHVARVRRRRGCRSRSRSAWTAGQLPGAPLEHCDGHLLVVRGLDATHVHVNDPAHPAIATRYPRAALDLVFRDHGGVAYLLAPRERSGRARRAREGAEPARRAVKAQPQDRLVATRGRARCPAARRARRAGDPAEHRQRRAAVRGDRLRAAPGGTARVSASTTARSSAPGSTTGTRSASSSTLARRPAGGVPGRAHLAALDARAPRTYADAPFARGDALVFGERDRRAAEALLAAQPERTLRIPMRAGAVRSINLATAAGVVTYAALARRVFRSLR